MINEIITDVLRAEGWDEYTNDPDDRGGPTKWGITQKAWSDYIRRPATPEDIQSITEPQAREFYLAKYVKEPGFDKLPSLLVPLLVDCGVNHGPVRAIRWLQRVVGAFGDGDLGPKTLAAVQSRDPVATYLRVCARRVRFYGAIVRRDRSQAKFISGWNNRAAKWIEVLADRVVDG
jgi:lysozyme family protein